MVGELSETGGLRGQPSIRITCRPADLQQRRRAFYLEDLSSPVPRSTQAAGSMLAALPNGSSAMHSMPSSRRLLRVQA